jgi:hypothetical protein
MFSGLASAAFLTACSAGDLTAAESLDDGVTGRAQQALGSAPNLALGKPASQSSQYAYGGEPWRAVDGNTNGIWGNGSVTHTETQAQAWWQVDLQGSQPISSVVLHNRTDCCSERLQNFRVRVSEDGTNWQDYPFTGVAPVQSTFAINRSARYVRVQLDGTGVLSLAEVQVLPPVAQALITVDTAGCSTNVAINNGIGQSFRVNNTTSLDKLELWMKPELYYTTSYAMEVFDGEGVGGTKLATSATTLTLNSQTAGTPSGFYGFTFAGQGVTLQPNRAYTFRLVRLSQYSGAFSECGNIYPNGIEYWLGSSAYSPADVSFKLYGSKNLALESLTWSASGPGTPTSTPDSTATDGMKFDYFLSGSDVWNLQSWTFSATAPRSTTLNFNWNYTGFHAWYMVHAKARAFADGPNGRTYVDLYTRSGGDVWDVSGTASLQVHAGHAFGFLIEGQNYDSDSRLLGTLKVTSLP